MDFQSKYRKAKRLQDTGKLLEANKIYKQLFNEEPDCHSLLVMIAINYINSGDDDHYIKFATKYLENVPKNERTVNNDTIWTLYHHLGIVYGRKNKPETALFYLNKAISIKSDPQSIRYAGQACIELDHEKEAISYWRTAAKLGDGESILALNSRGIDI